MSSLPVIHIAIAEYPAIPRRSLVRYINTLDPRFNVYIDAQNGKDLLHIIDTASYQPDICILDIAMPEMDGFTTVAELKQKYPLVKTIGFSEADDKYPILRMISNGASGFVSKAENEEELTKTINGVYNDGFSVSAHVHRLLPKLSDHNAGKLLWEMYSDKEIEFLSLCAKDLTYAEIGKRMNLSTRTAENYASRLRGLTNTDSRIGLAIFAKKNKLVN